MRQVAVSLAAIIASRISFGAPASGEQASAEPTITADAPAIMAPFTENAEPMPPEAIRGSFSARAASGSRTESPTEASSGSLSK